MSKHLITPAELQIQLSNMATAPVVLDVRWGGPGSSNGEAKFERGHIPGARWVDLDTVLSDPSTEGAGGRHPLPTPERFEAGMRAVGVLSGSPVVVYDDSASVPASRAWWLLRMFGHGDVSVLDGGWGAWRAAGHPVEEGAATETEIGDFEVGAPALTLLDAEDARSLSTSGVLLDGRPANRFRGQDEIIDPVAGRIPGARSLPAADLVHDDGRFLPPSTLRARFADVGVEQGTPVAAYCGSGVQACHVALAAAVAGITDDMGVYAGSWSDWITDPSRPVVSD